MSKYQEFEGKQVYLSDVLGLLDERSEVMTEGLIKAPVDYDEESLKHRLGKIQGVRLALSYVLQHFGATQEID